MCSDRALQLLGGLAFVVASLCGLSQGYAASKIKHVIVIAMENSNAFSAQNGRFVYNNFADAPYINSLVGDAAIAVNFIDPLPLSVPSEAHYVYMEAGTSKFADFTFAGGITGDFDPSATRSTASREHLTAQIEATNGRVTWRSYQEDITQACPIDSDGRYAAKHNPFVFFQDVAGNPPSPNNTNCAAHMRPYTALARDMAANQLASYNFITPNLCHDMHDACDGKTRVAGGDAWLKAELPGILKFTNRSATVVFLVWDEGNNSRRMPFLALGPTVRKGHVSAAVYDHGSMIKTVERIFRLPPLATVEAKNDLDDLFLPGALP